MMVSRKAKSRTAFALAATCLIAAVGLVSAIAFLQHRAGDLDPAGPAKTSASHGSPDETQEGDSLFPEVNWDYWLGVNSDIVAWVSMPGTELSYPIVQASKDDPQFYLRHDVYGTWNFAGCPYLDASCSDEGIFGSRNAVVFGHNMGGGDMRMFGVLGEFSNAEFAEANRNICIQTPQEKRIYRANFVQVINGNEESKATEFGSDSSFEQWYEESLDNACVVLDGSVRPAETITFCTCSYTRWDNERTITTASWKE